MHYTHPVFIVLLAAFIAPLLAEIRVGFRVPVVVLEIVLGVLIGPHVLNLASTDEFFDLMKGFGTAAVMFMAGMEIDSLSSSVTSLSLVVVITQIGLHTKSMSQDVAQALIAASVCSLLLYPALAGALLARNPPLAPPADPG